MSRATSKFGDYAVHIEWQNHKSGAYQFKQAKKDRKKVGELRKFTGGAIVFVIERRAEEMVYGKGSWAIPKSLLSLLRCLGSPDVEIVVSNGDTYRTTYANLDAKKFNRPDPKAIFLCFVLFEDFEYEKGEPESVAASMMIGKWK